MSTLTCAHCGHSEKRRMPEYAAKVWYECPNCGTVHKPLPNKCCVFCSFGSEPCPPAQRGAMPLHFQDDGAGYGIRPAE